MRAAVVARGYSIVLVTTEENQDMLREYLENVSSHNVDGIILCFLDEDDMIEPLLAAQEKVPIVLLSWNLSQDFNAVVFDLCESIYKTTKHLIELGRKRIAYIGGTIGSRVSKEKYRGYQKAMLEGSLEIQSDYYYEGNYQIATGYGAARTFMQSINPPDAVVCAADVLAIGFTKYLTQKQYNIPDDVAVTGLDNIILSRIFEPSITTCGISMQEASESAVSLLYDAIRKSINHKRQIMFRTKLFVRGSTNKDALIDFEL
jgi:DNA-binding LacI/PurR family transcriptional regulator